MGRVSCEHERQYYAKRRLAKLRTVCPDLPDDVLERVGLRQLSYSVRRAGKLVEKLLNPHNFFVAVGFVDKYPQTKVIEKICRGARV